MKKIYILLIGILGFHLFLLFNLRFTAWPEMLSYPYLFSHGFALYHDFIYPYPPLLTAILSAVYSVFGFKIQVLQIFTWIYILAIDFVLYLILKKIINKSLLIFLLLITYIPLQSFLDGNMLWFDNALVLPVLSAFYFTLRWLDGREKRYLYLSSLVLTTAIFIKQTALIYYLIFSIFVFLKSKQPVRVLAIPLVSGFAFLFFLVVTGSLKDFWNWVIFYPLTFWSKFPGYSNFNLEGSQIRILIAIFFPIVFVIPVLKNLLKKRDFLFLVLLLAGSIIAIYPRFSFFHLQPTIALLFLVLAYISKELKLKSKLLFLAVIFLGVIVSIKTVFPWEWGRSTRFYEKDDMNLISMVSTLSRKDEKVFLLGLQSHIYALSDRLPPKPWADNFGWYYEIPGFQDEVIKGFEKNPPKKIFTTIPSSGNWYDLATYRPKKLVEYIKANYFFEGESIKGIQLWERN